MNATEQHKPTERTPLEVGNEERGNLLGWLAKLSSLYICASDSTKGVLRVTGFKIYPAYSGNDQTAATTVMVTKPIDRERS
jgi:hypothetical protein